MCHGARGTTANWARKQEQGDSSPVHYHKQVKLAIGENIVSVT